jgi:hypothetical protein
MTHATPGASRAASASDSPTSDDAPAAEGSRPIHETARVAARDAARNVAGRLSALPRLAAAGAARARGAVRPSSDAEREAQRREEALEAAESGAHTDWAHVGIFSAGVAVGALIGAGVALLLAPATGFETRTRLVSTARRSSARAADRLGELGEGARRGTKRGTRRLGRAATSARWAAEDAWERRRRGQA